MSTRLRWMKCSNCHHENYAHTGDKCDWNCGGVFTKVLEEPKHFPVNELLKKIQDSDYMKTRKLLEETSTRIVQ